MRVFEKVIQNLQRLISQQELKVGDKLPAERKLCELFQVSRSSLRQAIAELNQQKVVETRLGDGTYILKVPENSPHLFKNTHSYQIIPTPLIDLINQDPSYRFDVQEARLILEGGTAWYAAERATKQDKEKILYYYNQIAYYQSLGDNEQAAIHDAKFHLAIAEASHNLVLIQMMKELFDLLQFNILLGRRKVYSNPLRFDQLQQQHYEVMTAINQGQPAQARDAVCRHIDFVIQQVRSIDDDEARQQRANRLAEI